MKSGEDKIRRRVKIFRTWWTNYEVLDCLFQYLDLRTLKVARLVCNVWEKEATKKLSGKIGIHYSSSQNYRYFWEKRDSLRFQQFCAERSLSIRTVIRLTKYSTMKLGGRAFLNWPYNPYNVRVEHLFKIHFTPVITPFVSFLHIELGLTTSIDFLNLEKILKSTPNLTALSLDLCGFFEDLIRDLDLDRSSTRRVKFFGLRLFMPCHEERNWMMYMTLKTFTYLFQLFSEIEYFYVDVCGTFVRRRTDSNFCVDAISILQSTTSTLANLKGLAIAANERDEGWRPTELHIPYKLSYLTYMFSSWSTTFSAVEDALEYHAETLLEFSLHYPYTKMVWPLCNLPFLPVLHTLTFYAFQYASTNTKNLDHIIRQEQDLRNADVFNLRTLFQGGNMDLHLPSLKSLTIILPYRYGEEVFNYIFGIDEKCKKQKPIYQLTYLAISLVTDCKGNTMFRLNQRFPNLCILKHVREVKEGLRTCEHRRPVGDEHFKIRNIKIGNSGIISIESVRKQPCFLGYKLETEFSLDASLCGKDWVMANHVRISKKHRPLTRRTTFHDMGDSLVKFDF